MKCDICNKGFYDEKYLEGHKKLHTGEAVFTCNYCTKSFISKTALKVHLRSHTGEKPYKCDSCQQSFSRKSNLDRHKSLHSNDDKVENMNTVDIDMKNEDRMLSVEEIKLETDGCAVVTLKMDQKDAHTWIYPEFFGKY